VSHQGAISKFYAITCGVPQGSSLSPTLFILFFSDVVKSLPSNVKVALYADYLCIWATHKSFKKASQNPSGSCRPSCALLQRTGLQNKHCENSLHCLTLSPNINSKSKSMVLTSRWIHSPSYWALRSIQSSHLKGILKEFQT
jgi:hypothetical protein